MQQQVSSIGYMLSEVTLERQALGFGFRIVGGTEEGSQVTVGHIVANGGKNDSISAQNENREKPIVYF